MNAEDLLEEWEDGEETGLRPARVQELRDDLREATGMAIPRSPSHIEAWLETMRGQVTRSLREEAGRYDDAQPDETTDEEESDDGSVASDG